MTANGNENELAYDGSSRPQDRELTARERDILCRVINDILRHGVKDSPYLISDGPTPGYVWSPVPVGIGEPDFFKRLADIGAAIDPRES